MKPRTAYAKRIDALLTPNERKIFRNLNSPIKIQDFLESFPVNFELDSHTYKSPRSTLATGSAHCLEGAVLAAAILSYHGHKPLLMDFQTAYDDEDHVVAVYMVAGRYGALSKTNHPVLRFRDAVYANPRELAMSFFHEYFLFRNGKKSLRKYSEPFDLSKFNPENWITTTRDLDWLVERLDKSRHYEVAPRKAIKSLRPVPSLEISAAKIEHEPDPRVRNL